MSIKNRIGELDFKPCFIAYIILSAIAMRGVIIMLEMHYTAVLYEMGADDYIPVFNIIIFGILKLLFFLMVAKNSRWKRPQFTALLLSEAAMCSIMAPVLALYIVDFVSLFSGTEGILSLKALLFVIGYCLIILSIFLCCHIVLRIKTAYINKAQIAKSLVVFTSFVMTFFAFTSQIAFFITPSFYRNYSSLIIAILLAAANGIFLIALALKDKLGRKVSGGLLVAHSALGILWCLLTVSAAGELAFFLQVFFATALTLSGQIISYIIARKKHPSENAL